MHTPLLNLLRRTSTVCLALAALCGGTAFAQTFTCSNPTITPNNSFTITCNPQTTAPPVAGAAGTFSLSAPGSLTTGQGSSVTVSRSGGATGGYTATVSTSGSCSGSGSVVFADGFTTATGSNTVAITAGGTAGSCTVSLSLNGPTGTTPGTPASIAGSPAIVAVNAQAAPPPPPAAGCPTDTSSAVSLRSNTVSGTATPVNLPSGSIGSFALPLLPAGHTEGLLQVTESSQTPNGAVTIEFQISRCKGQIDPNAGVCYYTSHLTNFNSLNWAAAPMALPPALVAAFGICTAYQSDGTWYANLRWTYSACNAGANNCGFTVTWYDGGAQ